MEENKKKVKKKVKIKKKKIFIPIIIIILLVCIGGGFFLYKYIEKDTIKNIKSVFNKYVITNKDTKLYNKNKKVIGNIGKDFELELSIIKNIGINNKYLNIKDTDYYIYYKDIKKIKEIKSDKLNDYYITLNKNIKTNNNIDLYKDKNKVLTINNELNIPIQYMDKDNYYVLFLNKLLSIKKSKDIKEVDNKNNDSKESEYISVLYYDNVNNTCNDYNCIPSVSFKDQINKLKENGYYSISKEDYLLFINDYVRLKEKAYIIDINNINDDVNNIAKELEIKINKFEENDGIKFNTTNKKSLKTDDKNSINRYQIKGYSTVDNVLKMVNGEDVVESEPVKVNKSYGVPVLNYHFFYDPSQGEGCNESICLDVAKFRQHLEYLKNNGYKALTMKEFVKWIYGEIDVPEKSVLITIDDGAMGTGTHNGNKLIPLLEEYKMHATLFLIAGWWKTENYKSDYLEIQSHTYDMHQYGSCGKGQLVCATYEEAKADLQLSLQEIKDNTSFCYPFYSYDDEAIQAIKELGFKVAFAGGNVNATRNSDKYKVPRYPILSDITMNRFIEIVS